MAVRRALLTSLAPYHKDQVLGPRLFIMYTADLEEKVDLFDNQHLL